MLAHDLAEAALKIADAPVPLVKGRMDPGAVQVQRLQVKLCKWLAAKLLPRVYGDKLTAEVTGLEGGPVPLTLSPIDWGALLKRVTEPVEPATYDESADPRLIHLPRHRDVALRVVEVVELQEFGDTRGIAYEGRHARRVGLPDRQFTRWRRGGSRLNDFASFVTPGLFTPLYIPAAACDPEFRPGRCTSRPRGRRVRSPAP